MPITFRSKHSPNVIMLETVGLEVLKLMGLSGTVPGALNAEDIPRARTRLEQAVQETPGRVLGAKRDDDDDRHEREPPVPLANRALPLLEMLRTAEAEGDHVIWER